MTIRHLLHIHQQRLDRNRANKDRNCRQRQWRVVIELVGAGVLFGYGGEFPERGFAG